MIGFLKYFYRIYKKIIIRERLLRENSSCRIGQNFIVSFPENLQLGIYIDILNNCELYTEGGLYIGDYTQISENCTIFSDEHLYDIGDYIPISNKKIKKPVTIEEFVVIGANVSILPGVTIGKGSFIGMGSVVVNSIPPYSIALGNPARVIKKRDKEEFERLLEEKKFFQTIKGGLNYEYRE
jgi:acetyltransferase-like isoleucine patch superfamily enzyme